MSESACDGLCITGADIGIPGPGVAYPHPSCPEHAPDAVCRCGMPDRCLSPTHGQIGMSEALEIRHRQDPFWTPPEPAWMTTLSPDEVED